MEAGASRPICEFCGKPKFVIQHYVYGLLKYLHPWCVYGYSKLTEPIPTPQE